MTVHHYTTKEAYDEIMKTKNFSPSTPWTALDATYGSGWYFTDLDPNICDMAIAHRCWLNTSTIALKKVEYYLKWDINDTLLKKTRQHVYMIPSNKWDQNLIKFLESGKVRNCPSKPCETCETGKKYKK